MRDWAIWLGLGLAGLTAYALLAAGYSRDIAVVGSVAVICVVWWVLEPIPIPVTSLLPLSILPLLGVLTPAQVGQAYGSPIILLLLGGFLVVLFPLLGGLFNISYQLDRIAADGLRTIKITEEVTLLSRQIITMP